MYLFLTSSARNVTSWKQFTWVKFNDKSQLFNIIVQRIRNITSNFRSCWFRLQLFLSLDEIHLSPEYWPWCILHVQNCENIFTQAICENSILALPGFSHQTGIPLVRQRNKQEWGQKAIGGITRAACRIQAVGEGNVAHKKFRSYLEWREFGSQVEWKNDLALLVLEISMFALLQLLSAKWVDILPKTLFFIITLLLYSLFLSVFFLIQHEYV